MPVLGLTGDVMLGRNVDRRRRTGDAAAVWGDVLDRLVAVDGLLINLECCLSTRGTKWTGTYHPYHFRADPDWAVPALSAAGVDGAALANNHLLDFGPAALRDTLDALDSAGVAHAGAGETVAAARRPAAVECGDARVAFVSFTDNTPEFAAGTDDPGVAYLGMDPDDVGDRRAVRDAVAAARDLDPDIVVASLHWGPNMRERPSERLRRFGRFLAESEVDLVHGHSAHVFQGVEVHEGTPICYDCGDFVDDYAVDDDRRNDRSFLFRADLDDGEIRRLRLLPTEIRRCAVYEADPEAAAWSRDRMRRLSANFGTEFSRDGEELVLSV